MHANCMVCYAKRCKVRSCLRAAVPFQEGRSQKFRTQLRLHGCGGYKINMEILLSANKGFEGSPCCSFQQHEKDNDDDDAQMIQCSPSAGTGSLTGCDTTLQAIVHAAKAALLFTCQFRLPTLAFSVRLENQHKLAPALDITH